jgi:alkylation response protein AidB-like acyl-CoA dehydrogenase
MPEIETSGALLEVARSFRPRILAERDHIEASRRLPEDLARELARDGFFRIFLPKAYGGLDLTPREALEIFEELARADASVAWCVWNGNTHWMNNKAIESQCFDASGQPVLEEKGAGLQHSTTNP